MLNNKLPNQQSSQESIFDIAKSLDPSSFIKTESPEYLSVKSITDMANNLFIPFGPILTTTSLNFTLYARSGKPYTMSIPLGNDTAIKDRAQALVDRYSEAHPKEAYISNYHRWNILAVKNIKYLNELLSKPDKLAEYKAELDKLQGTMTTPEGYLTIPANVEVPQTICRAKTLGLPYSIISKLSEAGIDSLDYTIHPINIVYNKQAVAGTYLTEVTNLESPVNPEILPYIVVPSFALYESLQESQEFKDKVNKLLDMIENGRSPVRWSTAASIPQTDNNSIPSVNSEEQPIESSGAFI